MFVQRIPIIFTLLLAVSCWLSHSYQLQKCNSVSRQKRTVIKTPTGATTDNMCRYTIEPSSQFVCQVRIDFEHFEMGSPDLNPGTQSYDCSDTDFLQVGRFKLCGHNSGQHLYLPLKRNSAESTLKFDFYLRARTVATGQPSTWQIILTQLDCYPTQRLPKQQQQHQSFFNFGYVRNIFSSNPILPAFGPNTADYELLAPLGCHQYFTTTTGQIRSFNFKNGGQSEGVYPTNLAYTICIRSGQGSEIEYTFNRFAMSGSQYTDSGYDSDCHPMVHTPGRPEDYLLIPQASFANNGALQPSYFCGGVLNGATIRARAPFIMYFSSDELSDATEIGFDLTYKILVSTFEQNF